MKKILFSLLLFIAAVPQAFSALTIEITEGVEGALPIAIVPFAWQQATPPPQDIAGIIKSDLARSGRFAPLKDENLIARPHEGSQVRYQNWRVLNMEYLVVGGVQRTAQGDYTVRFELLDVFKGSQLLGFSYQVKERELRQIAHHISDQVYEKLTGQRGAFNTRIAYITVDRRDGKTRHLLNVADADGYGEQNILDSPSPLMSVSWSPDGNTLAYVSFEGRRSRIYLQEVTTGHRTRLTDFKGLNGAPAWSPDGRRLAMTLSRDGNPEIYVMQLQDRSLTRMTRHGAIDTEPTWAPDGRSIVFTSDRGGKPQLYRLEVDARGPRGSPRRLTFEGDYNTRAAFSADGRMLTFISGNRGAYRVAVMELPDGHMRILTNSYLDESPSFAPNGSMIIYATSSGKQGVLAAVSVDGRVHQRLAVRQGDVREPAWSPYNR
jgi:TolB protein